jgi:hypothetical protein
MHALEEKFAAAAAADGDIYLPNFTPFAPVDAILIGMEPSLRWTRTPGGAALRIAAGFRNFMWSPEDFILHYAARHFLCSNGRTYHITDVSKGAMAVAQANVDRDARYARWIVLLREEVELIAKPHARIVAIGREVRALLGRHGFDRDVDGVMHYSAQASRSRNPAVEGREPEFSAFARTLSMEDIVAVADAVMRENSISIALSNETISRLQKAKLSESRKKLAFIYSTAFREFDVRKPWA